jgi:DNA transformation protein and related proteins
VNKKVRMENTSYFQPPPDAHEDPEAMLPWARLALDSALRARSAAKPKKPRTAKKPVAAKRGGGARRTARTR